MMEIHIRIHIYANELEQSPFSHIIFSEWEKQLGIHRVLYINPLQTKEKSNFKICSK